MDNNFGGRQAQSYVSNLKVDKTMLASGKGHRGETPSGKFPETIVATRKRMRVIEEWDKPHRLHTRRTR